MYVTDPDLVRFVAVKSSHKFNLNVMTFWLR